MDEPTTQTLEPVQSRGWRILPWIIAAVALVIAAVAIGAFAANELGEPKPVSRLTAQSGPAPGMLPIDDEVAAEYNVTDSEFVSYGSYGAAELWSTTQPDDSRCLAVIVEGDTWIFRCAAPTFDTIAGINIESNMVPPAPSGEPTSNVRFVLRDGAVDVYLAPHPEGGYY